MASAIVRSTYRYKRPPRKRKAVALEAPAVVTTKSGHRPHWEKEAAAAEVSVTARHNDGGAAQPSTPRAAARVAPPPANDDRKSAIVTVRRKSRFGDAPDLTPEEHQRRARPPTRYGSNWRDGRPPREAYEDPVSCRHYGAHPLQRLGLCFDRRL
jgi:hypothetical protein